MATRKARPVTDAEMDASWEATGIHFKKPEWPPIPVAFKVSNVERSEPLPEDLHKVEGGRFTNKKPRKPVQDGLFGDADLDTPRAPKVR
jgi:hypothetical protein